MIDAFVRLLVEVVATGFALGLFWLVAKTIGRLRIVKKSPTVDDITDFVRQLLLRLFFAVKRT